MKKLFISHPMTGLSNEEILAERCRVTEKVKELFKDEIVVMLDSYVYDYNPTSNRVSLLYLARSLEILADADIVYFAKGWTDSIGCRVEYVCAVNYGIPFIDEEGK